jgi:predicted DNA-binding ArsR family transcriptional regulator
MKFITAKEVGEKWGISNRRIQLLCKQGRIEGAYRLGWTWAIPEDAEKPKDIRRKEYRKSL